MSVGLLGMVLHAHLPFVRHPEHPRFLEENWLFECITETYLPLLDVFFRLKQEGIPFRFTITMTPSLLAMLDDALLQSKYSQHLDQLIHLARKESMRLRWDQEQFAVVQMYLERYQKAKFNYEEKYQRNLIEPFADLQKSGYLEIITCAATHAFLPAYQSQPIMVKNQIHLGVQAHKEYFGVRPHGIWLPECGYFPGLDEILTQEQIKYTFLETHGVLMGNPSPIHGVYAPVKTPAGLCVFGRDQMSSHTVWSKDVGYPADPDYREFYKDVAHELDPDYLGPYFYAGSDVIGSGMKYHAITGLGQKNIYKPDVAEAKAKAHAHHFVESRIQQMKHLAGLMQDTPMVIAPYDAELFGHWWYEGPIFIEALARECHARKEEIKLSTPYDVLQKKKKLQVVEPAFSSWGQGGYAGVWVNQENDWVYPLLFRMAHIMQFHASAYKKPDYLQRRILNQMVRELVLAQSSDWTFIIKNQTSAQYASNRVRMHYDQFMAMHQMLLDNKPDEKRLSIYESRNNIFPTLDYRIYAGEK
jgi:1,4-alpha-glucan branching enzyme